MILRSLVWGLLAILTVVVVQWFRVALDVHHIRLLVAPKIPFFGLIAAIGTFQYRVWRDLVSWADTHLQNPQWLAFERATAERRAAGGIRSGDDAELAKWRAHKEEVKKYMREGIMPHNAIILTNVVCIATLLLVSCAMDVASFMARGTFRSSGPSLRAPSFLLSLRCSPPCGGTS